MPLILNSDLHYAVERDGLPRVADYDDGTQQVLYFDRGQVRSMLADEWLVQRGPLPVEPTPAESAAAERARAQQAEAARARREALRGQLRAAVAGKRVAQMTLPELRDLVGVLAEMAGLLDEDGVVR